MGRLYDRNALAVALITAAALSAFIFGLFAMVSPDKIWAVHSQSGSFYAIMGHGSMVALFGSVGLFVVLAWVMGFMRFWRDTGESLKDFVAPRTFGQAVWDVLTLKYLDGGGDGCTYPDEKPSFTRRTFHHFTFYGFLLCFAATSTGTIFHYGFGWVAPYTALSLVKIFGTLGGIGLIIGPIGLIALKHRADKAVSAQAQRGMDMGFLVLLILTSITGFALWFLRDTPAMALVLAIHLGVVLGFFLTLPYGKFVHAIYRFAALVRYALERSRPNPAASFE
jgi:citrate/tricarballylate utilization protein